MELSERWAQVDEAILDVLNERSVMLLEDLAAHVITDPRAEVLATSQIDPTELVEEALFGLDEVWTTRAGHVLSVPSILRNRVFTTSTVGREKSDAVQVAPDFEPLLYATGASGAGEGISLGGGQKLNLLTAPGPAAETMLFGPPGWLATHHQNGHVGLQILGVSEAEIVDCSRLTDGQREVAALRLAVDLIATQSVGEWAGTFVLEALAVDPKAFTEPTLPLTDLFTMVGLEERDSEWGPADTDWVTSAQRAREAFVERTAADFGLDIGDEQRLGTVFEAWRSAAHGRPHPEVSDGTVADFCSHGRVAPAFVELFVPLTSSVTEKHNLFVQRMSTNGTTGGVGGAYLAGRLASHVGNTADAEGLFNAIHAADSAYAPVRSELGRIALDRSDLDAAQRHLRATGYADDELLADAVRAVQELGRHRLASVGRNERCPCGSGAKFKQCCDVNPVLTSAEQKMLLSVRLHEFVARSRSQLTMDDLAERLIHFTPDITFGEALSEPLVLDVVLFEEGALARYLELRGHRLSDEDQRVLRAEVTTERGLYRVLAADDAMATVAPLDGGSPVVVERIGFEPWSKGSVMMARVCSDSSGSWLTSQPVEIDEAHVASAAELLAAGPSGVDIMTWYANRPELLGFDSTGLPAGDLIDLDEIDLTGIDIDALTSRLLSDLE